MSNDTDNEIVEAEAPELDPVIEKEARQNGWVPQEQFRGEPEDWMDAPAFVKKGREINPILRKNNERLQRELDSNKAELKELQLTTKEFAAEFAKMKENAYKRAIADLKVQRREALKEDDHTLVDELEERIDTLKEEQAKKPEPKREATGPDMTVLNAWRQENQWYDEAREPDLFDAAEAAALRISRTIPGLTGREFLDKVTETVKAKFPDKFENPRRKAAMHEGGGARGESKRGKSYANLPADAKATCDRFVKKGLMTKEAYVDAYEWE